MIRPVTAPYLVPDPDVLELGDWLLVNGEETEPLGAYVEYWTTGNDLLLNRSVTLDSDRVREECRLPGDAPLGIVVSWMSSSSKMRQQARVVDCSGGPTSLRATLPGDRIGGRVEVSTSLVLLEDIADPPAGAPHRAGSILVRDVVGVALEGDGSMFPMAVADFREHVLPESASWYVRTSTNPDTSFSGTFQVLVNELDQKLVTAIKAEKPSREQRLRLDHLCVGVLETVLDLAYQMRSDGILDGSPREEGTVGFVLEDLINSNQDIISEGHYEVERGPDRRVLLQGIARRRISQES